MSQSPATLSPRILALATVVAAGSGLVLDAVPGQVPHLVGAFLSVTAAAAAAWQVYRLPGAGRPVTAPPVLPYPGVKSVARPEGVALAGSVWEHLATLSQDRVIAQVAQHEVAALLKDVTTNAAELLRATTSVRAVMEQLERSVGTIAEGSRNQSDMLTAAAGHSGDSAEAVTRIAEEAAQLALVVRETAGAAKSGAGLLAEAGSVVSGLGAVVSDSNAAMSRLAGLSSQIGALVDTIGGVAKQSNLLALNAAIEAARAGANGRSFGVVAEAMRDLANKAGAASGEASRLIAQVQAETQHASEAVVAGGRQVEASTGLVGRVVTDLRAILEQTAGIEGGMVAISEHAAVAEAAARKLADQIAAVADVSARASAEAGRMAESSREASSSIKAIAHVSRHYAQVPEQVRASLVPVERAVAEAGTVVEELEPLVPAAGQGTGSDPEAAGLATGSDPEAAGLATGSDPEAAGLATGARTTTVHEVRYADWQPWENCRSWWHLDRFLTQHPDVQIRHLHLSNADFSGQLALPEAPDVTWAAPDWAPQLLQPIDDLIERDGFDLSSFVPGVVESLRRLGGGRIYGLPMHLNMPLMVYNKNLFARAGVAFPKPGTTWEELIPLLERVRDRTGAHGIEIDMRNAHFLPFALHFLAPAGAALMDDGGTRVNATPAVAEQLRFLSGLSQRNLLLPYDQLWAPVRPFVQGQAAVLIGSTATLLFTPIREMAARGELNFVPEVTTHPVFRANSGVTAAPNYHVIGIHRFARNREACWQLLRHLVTDQERIRGDILRWGQAPVQYDEGVRAAYAELGRQGAPTTYHEIWAVKTAPMPQYILTPGFRRLETVAGHEMALLMAGQKSPEEVLRALAAAM